MTPEQRMQLRNTAIQEAVRLVASQIAYSNRMYAVAENIYDYIEKGITPQQFDKRDETLRNLLEEKDG